MRIILNHPKKSTLSSSFESHTEATLQVILLDFVDVILLRLLRSPFVLLFYCFHSSSGVPFIQLSLIFTPNFLDQTFDYLLLLPASFDSLYPSLYQLLFIYTFTQFPPALYCNPSPHISSLHLHPRRRLRSFSSNFLPRFLLVPWPQGTRRN